MPAAPFIALNNIPGQTIPKFGASVIDNWTPSTGEQLIVRGFTLAEILPVLWNCKTLRTDLAFQFQTKDGATNIASGNYTHNDTVTGDSLGTAPEPRDRIAQGDGVLFRFVESRFESTHEIEFSVSDILNQGTEWAIEVTFVARCVQYHDDQANVDFTNVSPAVLVITPDSLTGYTLLSTVSVSFFGKTATLNLYGTTSLNAFTFWNVSASVYASESWTY